MHYIKEHPFTIDFAVIKVICNKLNLKISEIEKVIDSPDNTLKFAFEAFKRGAKIEGSDFKLTESDVEELLNESYGDFIYAFNADVLKMFSPSKKEEKKS